MKRILFLFLTTSLILSGWSQNNDQNWVKSIIYKVPVTQSGNADAGNAHIEINYFDGLGRPIQNIKHAEAANGGDIITHIEYDPYGRQTQEFLPYIRTNASMDFEDLSVNDIINFYQNTPGIALTSVPFSEKELENSPMNRVLRQAAPGEDWQMDSGHEIKYDYLTNEDNEVRMPFAQTDYAVNLDRYNPTLTGWSSYYPAGTLYKTITVDENNSYTRAVNNTGTQSIEYKDKSGKVVLKRIVTPQLKTYDTYYVYDIYGNLTYVIPPKAADNTVLGSNTVAFQELCYQYKYDQRNRLVAKKIPGKHWEYMVYDQLDRLRATGPVKSPFEDINAEGWLFTKYDVFDRPVYTLWMEDAVNETKRITIQNEIASAEKLSESRIEPASEIGNIEIYYTNQSFPDTGDDYYILTINYYDDYIAFGINDVNQVAAAYGQDYKSNTKTLSTGTWTRVLENSTDINAITGISLFKDDHLASPIKNISHYPDQGLIESISEVDFEGKVLQTQTTHRKDGSAFTIDIHENFTYTPQGRLAQHTHQINNFTEENIALNNYNILGQLTGKKVGRQASDPLQEVTYAYNIRGWLTDINDIHQPNGQLFYFGIKYNTGNHPLYNGNISETYWKSLSDNQLRNYSYAYDNLNRLIAADYLNVSDNIQDTYNVYLTYDKNGNILTLQRNGGYEDAQQTDQIDNLQYSYADNGNRLINVSDDTGNIQGFADGNTGSNNDYEYDTYGNMLRDRNKNIDQISYNHMNLPTHIQFYNGTGIDYKYDAAGVKLQKTLHYGTYDVVTDYMGGYQYETKPVAQGGRGYAELLFFPTAEGYVKAVYKDDTSVEEPARYQYVYIYKDHLGNNRLSYTLDPETQEIKILEENHYYPFGLKQEYYNTEKREVKYKESVPSKRAVEQVVTGEEGFKYKYNGKEWQDELGLDWYDYGARNYDAALGRFMNLDPLTEKYNTQSPYVYADNKPVLFKDINGEGTEEQDWIPVVSDKGDVSYVAEESDIQHPKGPAFTFAKQFGLDETTANQLVPDDIEKGQAVSGLAVKMITGNEILKLDLKSKFADDQHFFNQLIFGIKKSKFKTADKYDLDLTNYFKNINSVSFSKEGYAIMNVSEKKINVHFDVILSSITGVFTNSPLHMNNYPNYPFKDVPFLDKYFDGGQINIRFNFGRNSKTRFFTDHTTIQFPYKYKNLSNEIYNMLTK